jgi:hypothetical protein
LRPSRCTAGSASPPSLLLSSISSL